MRNPIAMGSRVYLPIHSRRLNWNCFSQLLLRHRPTRHILCCSPLPLCSIHGCSLCHCGWFRTLIPPFYRLYPSFNLNKNPLWHHVYWRKLNILPSTLLRLGRNTSTLLRLPRRLYIMKHNFLNRLSYLTRCSNHVLIYYLRSIRHKT